MAGEELLHGGSLLLLKGCLLLIELGDLDWSAPSNSDLTPLFLRAARLTGDRHLDVSKAIGKKIEAKLRDAGVAPIKLHPLSEVITIAQADRAMLFGESLPPGISLG